MFDPRRPARDLLEHLLAGIESCHQPYGEYTDEGLVYTDEDPVLENRDDTADAERRGQVTEEFTHLMREQAAIADSQLG